MFLNYLSCWHIYIFMILCHSIRCLLQFTSFRWTKSATRLNCLRRLGVRRSCWSMRKNTKEIDWQWIFLASYKMYRIRCVSGLGKRGRINTQITQTHASTGTQFAVVKRWTSSLDKIYPRHDNFAERHIGPNEVEKKAMLDFIGMKVSLFPFIIC